jgi:hypothetical protein
VDCLEYEFPILGSINEYRTTQVGPSDSLVGEISRLRDALRDVEAREQISHLLALVRRASVTSGTYLEFVGD